MRCTNCDTELIPGKRFCHHCGARAVTPCPHCGAQVDPTFRFCPDCGTRLDVPGGAPQHESAPAAAPEPPPAGAPLPAANDQFARLARHMPAELAEKILASGTGAAGERKVVTVLFCDLVGSTAIAEQMDPEEYHDLLGEYLEVAFKEIYKFEGIVNQLAGDGFMALFGAPIAHEDAPQRAVRAALGIRLALEWLSQHLKARRGLELRARIGVNTGPVVVGAVGNDLKMDYTAIGDTTNVAARMQSLAEPGTILLSEATYRRVRGFFQLQPAGVFDVKGKSEPVAAYRVLGVSDATTPMAIAAARGLTPLVGRDAELAQLRACYRLLAEHLAQIVAIVGEAGSGKSRLLYEFRRQLADEDVVFLEARCSALSQALPYAPWTSMLKQFFELTPGEPAASAAEKVARRVRGMEHEERLYAYLCHILSIPIGGIGDVSADEIKRGTFEAVAHLVGSLCRRSPVIMVIEDLHWIDDASREMLELATTKLHGPVMLIISHRPDYMPLWRTTAAFTQLRLRALSEEHTAEIIRSVAGASLPAELEGLIRVKAEGNPFFAEEITRALLEEGQLVRSNGDLRLAAPIDEIRIPGTVGEVIAARVDRFGPDAKRVVQVAAVLGRQFLRHHVVGLLGREGIDVAAALDDLERRGVVHRKTVLSDDEYRFGESLTQEVAYESLLLKERRQLHERVGHLLEEEGGDAPPALAALVAHHFSLSDNREKALAALLRAAQRAETVPSFGVAARFYRQAWALAESALDGAEQPDDGVARAALDAAVGLARMSVIYTAGDEALAEHAARRGRELAVALGQHQHVAALWTFHGMLIVNGQRERFTEGVTLLERGLGVARDAGLTPVALSLSRGLAWGYMYDGRCEEAMQIFADVVHALEQTDDRTRLSDMYLGSRFMRDQAQYYAEDLAGGLANMLETYALAVRASNRTVQAGTSAYIALIHLARGEYDEALRWVERSVPVAESLGNVPAMRTTAAVGLVARRALGDTEVDGAWVDLIEQGFTARGDMALKGQLVVEALIAIGEVYRARNFIEVAYAHAGGRLREAICTAAFGRVMQHLGPSYWEDAARWYERARVLGAALGARSVQAAAGLGVAELAAARGEHAAAAAQIEEVRRICQAAGLRRYEQQATRLQAEIGAGVAEHA